MFISSNTCSTTNIATPNTYLENIVGFASFVAKFDNEGARLWGTYSYTNTIGENNYYTITTNTNGDLFCSGRTSVKNDISTFGIFQSQIAGSSNPNDGVLAPYSDSFVTKFNVFGRRIWGTYYGGDLVEYNSICIPNNNYFYICGTTQSTAGIATVGSQQPNFEAGNFAAKDAGNAFLAKFSYNPLATSNKALEKIELFPNPSKGSFKKKAT